MLPHISRKMSFEISEVLLHVKYLAGYICVISYVNEQLTDAYKCTIRV